jgi:hypothetical protein
LDPAKEADCKLRIREARGDKFIAARGIELGAEVEVLVLAVGENI